MRHGLTRFSLAEKACSIAGQIYRTEDAPRYVPRISDPPTNIYPSAVKHRDLRQTLSRCPVRALSMTRNTFRGTTPGHCPSHVQASLLILPSRFAEHFRGLCRRDPVSCPLLGENVAPGDPRIEDGLAKDGDVRTDAPGYSV